MIEFSLANYEKDSTTGQYTRNGSINYEVSVNLDTNCILFIRNGLCKSVKIEEDKHGYMYDIKKTKINANGGASGLYDFLAKEVRNNTTGGMASMIINKVFNYMK